MKDGKLLSSKHVLEGHVTAINSKNHTCFELIELRGEHCVRKSQVLSHALTGELNSGNL